MTVRKSAQRSTPLELVIDSLPEEFLTPEIRSDDREMAGLRTYVGKLTEHLRCALNQGNPPTIEVMRVLGIPPSEWYRAALGGPR